MEVHRLSRPAAARSRDVGDGRGCGGRCGGLAAAAPPPAAPGRPETCRCSRRRPAAIPAFSVNLDLFQPATQSSASSAEAARSIAATAQAHRSYLAASAATSTSDDKTAASGFAAASRCLTACSRGGQPAPVSGNDADRDACNTGRSSVWGDPTAVDGDFRGYESGLHCVSHGRRRRCWIVHDGWRRRDRWELKSRWPSGQTGSTPTAAAAAATTSITPTGQTATLRHATALCHDGANLERPLNQQPRGRAPPSCRPAPDP